MSTSSLVQAMAFSEQTFTKSMHDAWNSLVRPVGSSSAARNRRLSLLKSLAAAPVTRDLLKSTGAGQLINDKWLRNHDSQEVLEAAAACIRAWAEKVGVDSLSFRRFNMPGAGLREPFLTTESSCRWLRASGIEGASSRFMND